jgi:Predicted integral membrane protein
MTYQVRYISVSVNKPANDVYQFASNPENFPKWVAFIQSIRKEGDFWVAESGLGNIKIKWAPKNEWGILDHYVTLPNGETVYNPMRVISNNNGSEFIFTLFRMPGRSKKAFNEDAQAVTADLNKLKEIMEQ